MVKQVFKRKAPKIWAIASAATIIVATTVSILCTTVFSSLLNFAFGGPKNIYAEGQETAYSGIYDSKEAAKQNADQVNLEMCQEGMVLLKNKDNALPLQTPNSPTPASAKPKVSVFGKNSVDIAIGGFRSGGASGGTVFLFYFLGGAGL